MGLALGHSVLVEGGVVEIYIFLILLFLYQTQTLTKALVVDDFPLAQEANDVVHVRIVGQTQDVVVGLASLLLCCVLIGTTFSNPWGTKGLG